MTSNYLYFDFKWIVFWIQINCILISNQLHFGFKSTVFWLHFNYIWAHFEYVFLHFEYIFISLYLIRIWQNIGQRSQKNADCVTLPQEFYQPSCAKTASGSQRWWNFAKKVWRNFEQKTSSPLCTQKQLNFCCIKGTIQLYFCIFLAAYFTVLSVTQFGCICNFFLEVVFKIFVAKVDEILAKKM